MSDLARALFPEIVLCAAACVLLLMGTVRSAGVRRLTPVLAVIALIIAGASQLSIFGGDQLWADRWQSLRVFEFARYITLLSAVIGILLVLLAWPGNRDATANPALHLGTEAGEFYAMMLFSIAGIFLVAGANDIMLLFLGIELASIPTYIMVSISRPLAVAQEAGVKYFFLGAMAAAVMLFGFSYLYGTTGTTKLTQIETVFSPGVHPTPWQMLAIVMLIAGFAFKMAVVPLHVYAGDVYQGAATPVTAFLSFVPKISGFAALIKVLYAVTGGSFIAPNEIVKLLWILAVLTMTIGNVLAMVQSSNIKRVMAYSSVAHSGYMLAGVTALIHSADPAVHTDALHGVLFYLAAYGLMNIGVFGVLILLPSRHAQAATSAETFEDIAGMGRKHVLLGLAMAVSCFSLIGLPLTVGFFGKLYLIYPAFESGMHWLVILLVVNAAISAAYYLRIVGAMFLRAEPMGPRFGMESHISDRPVHHPIPVLVSVGVSMVSVLWLGIVLPSTDRLAVRTGEATMMDKVAMPNGQ